MIRDLRRKGRNLHHEGVAGGAAVGLQVIRCVADYSSRISKRIGVGKNGDGGCRARRRLARGHALCATASIAPLAASASSSGIVDSALVLMPMSP